jgi:hypothetical protein
MPPLPAYITAESIHHLLAERHAETTVIGIVLTAVSLLAMPIPRQTRTRRAAGLGGNRGRRNPKLSVRRPSRRRPDRPGRYRRLARGLVARPPIGLAIAAAALWEGIQSWRGADCAC